MLEQSWRSWEIKEALIPKKPFLHFNGEIFQTEQEFITFLKDISDFDELTEMRNKTPLDSKPEKLIEDRMVKVFRDISDFDNLSKMRRSMSWGSKPRKLIEDRMVEVFRDRTVILTEQNLDNFINKLKNNQTIANNKITQAIKDYLSELVK